MAAGSNLSTTIAGHISVGAPALGSHSFVGDWACDCWGGWCILWGVNPLAWDIDHFEGPVRVFDGDLLSSLPPMPFAMLHVDNLEHAAIFSSLNGQIRFQRLAAGHLCLG